mmetsp:Transcript_41353/g.104812  ORF Transcript_41353/g.104812 Transcript_41353/m.104812 type:complete len:613 (+) Transcript_41353:60-1898(+)
MGCALASTMSAMPQTETYTVEPERLVRRTKFYAERAGAAEEYVAGMEALLTSKCGAAVLAMSKEELHGVLNNDAYKAKMHKMYAKYYGGVSADFALNVRKTPVPLIDIEKAHPGVWRELLAALQRLTAIRPYDSEVQTVLKEYFAGFVTDKDMVQRAMANGVSSSIEWLTLGEGDKRQLVAIATGSTVEEVSHVETSLMQLVQEAIIKAQAEQIFKKQGVVIDRTERLANSLGKLAGSVSRINKDARDNKRTMKHALFAGRRSSDRAFLVLQNMFCLQHLEGIIGTSAIGAMQILHRVSQKASGSGIKPADGVGGLWGAPLQPTVNPDAMLIGTHAHELQSITQQMLHPLDYEAGGGTPVCVSTLASHLLFLSSNGGLKAGTALADTFGTQAFVELAMAADVPSEFVEDMAKLSAEPPIPAGSKVFDLIKIWRIDSGEYAEIAAIILDAWKRRCQVAKAQGLEPIARPVLMHSNLGSVEELLETVALQEDIRPFALGFGTLLDGFQDFELEGETAKISLASIVMKAVQARPPPKFASKYPNTNSKIVCACKLGDDVAGKNQFDPRVPEEAAMALKAEMEQMRSTHTIKDADLVSQKLAEAYRAVARDMVLGT